MINTAVRHNKKAWFAIAVAVITYWMIFLDMTGVAVILPTLQRDFHISNTTVQWVINIYLLTLSICIIMGGKLADDWGHKKAFLLALVIFLIGSILCAITPDIAWLLIGRAIQGVGGAVLMALAPAIVVNSFPQARVGRAMGIMMTFSALSLSTGPFLGGLFTQYISWRWIFWFNLPFSLIAFFIMAIFISLPQPTKKTRHDWLGFFTLSISIAFLLVAIMEGNNWGWGSAYIIISFFIAIIFFLIFFFYEKTCSFPLVNFSLFKNRSFSCVCVIYTVVQMIFITEVFLMFELQNVYDYTPVLAGIAGLPMVITYIFLGPIVGRIMDAYGARWPITIGLFCLAISFAWVAIFIYNQNYWLLFPGLMLMGLSLPFVTTTSMAYGLSVVSAAERGLASAIINGLRQLGASLGLGALGAVILGIYTHYIHNYLAKHELQQIIPLSTAKHVLSMPHKLSQLGLSATEKTAFLNAAKHAYSIGTLTTFGIVCIIIFFTFILALIMLRQPRVN